LLVAYVFTTHVLGGRKMMEITHGKEVVVTVKNDIGVLFQIAKLVAEMGVDVVAVNGSVSGENGTIRLITDDTLRTKDALAERGYSPREESVILMEVPHKSGMLRRVTEALAAENIDVHHVYAAALDNQEKCLLVLHTASDEHAIPKLQSLSIG
jgi:hypothetical protein